MKKIVTKGYYFLLVVFLSLGGVLTANAQYGGVNLETGGLYTALAKDAANNLYVTRVTPGTSGASYEVEKYTNGSGAPAVIYTGLTHQAGTFPWGLAVTSKGNVFISTDFTAGGGAIIKLTNSAGSYTASAYQSARFFTALAVDANDNLYDTEYDAAHHTYAVVKYPANSANNAAGTNLYDNLKSATGYTYPTGLAVASNGDVYVADAFSNVSTITDGGHVFKLTAASAYAISTVSTGNYSSALALDAAGNLFSTENRGSGYNLFKYAGASGPGAAIFNALHTNGIYYPWGIAVFSSANIFVADGDDGVNGGAVIQLSPALPTVTTQAVTSKTTTSATLNGQVNDSGSTTTVSFIYGTSPTLTGATTTPATTGGTINAGSGNTAVSLNITGLSPSITYYYTVSATNSVGTVQGTISSFVPPLALSYPTPKEYSSGVNITPLAPAGSTPPPPAYGSNVTIGSGFATPFGVAADVAGNIYVADLGNKQIKKIPAGGGAPVVLLSGFTTLTGVAVDAAGNLYVADASNTTINEYPAGTTTPVALATGFTAPYGIALDAKGNVYVADFSNNAVDKIPAGGGTAVPIGSGFSSPTGVAVDGAGNVYVADFGNGLLKEIPVNGGAIAALGSGFTSPVGVAVDPAGNLFIGDYGASQVYELPAGQSTPIALGSGYTNPTGVAVDGFGKLAVANYLGNTVQQLTPVGGYYLSMPLPAGLNFSTSTGIISGIPTTVTPAKNYKVTAYNAGGGTSAPLNIRIIPNAGLSKLVVNTAALSPAFIYNTYSYTASVANSVLTVTITPTTSDPAATVSVNGTAVTSGTPSTAIPLSVGPNTITVTVLGQDGNTTKNYTVVVTRAPSSNAFLSNITLSNGNVTPAFAASKTSYTAGVGAGLASMTVTPTSSVKTATITVNGIAVASGAASQSIPLVTGPNTITIVVTAQDGITTNTYTIVVTEAKSTNDNLLSLKPTPGPMSPTFSTAVTSYTESVANTVTGITLIPTTVVSSATVTVNGQAVTSGTESALIALAVGANTINTVVTAQSGATKTYTLTVTRASGNTDSFVPGISVSKTAETPSLDDDVILVHQGISPNGDGVNDFLVIDGIQAYPDNKLTIMNRNGQLIYEASGYENASKAFDGHSNKNGRMQLPGTYFYQLDYTANGIAKHKTGFIVLKY